MVGVWLVCEEEHENGFVSNSKPKPNATHTMHAPFVDHSDGGRSETLERGTSTSGV